MANLSDFFAGGGAKPWVSGMTVAQWQDVISPADGETYRRKTATGNGTTDPSDDRTNYRPVSFDRVVSQPRRTTTFMGRYLDQMGTTITSLPELAVDVRTSILSVSGKGEVNFLAVQNTNYTHKGTQRLEVVVDGVTIFDASGSLGAATSTGLVAIGGFAPIENVVTPLGNEVFDKVRFSKSLQVFLTASGAAVPTGYIQLRALYKGYQ